MKLGSLFDGSGTAPLAAAVCGIEPAWASEIEPFPIKVTTKRFPGMKHLGSILDIDGAEVEPVDIICGGSPCQDLSVAGKQAGLHNGERSHLFFEMTRIIREMREATNGEYPKYVIWENVPGAFSSNNGNDFLAVLRAFAEVADPNAYVPRPASKGRTDRLDWKLSGTIVGDGWSIAWRTVDAQFWGVPQRRRRIYLVADLTGERAGAILFERKSVSGDSESCGAQRQGTAEDAEGCTGRSGEAWSLSAKQQSLATDNGCAATIGANGFKEPQTVVYPSVARCLTAEHDASPRVDRGQNIAVTSAGFVGRQGAKSGSTGYEQEVSPTLRQGITTDVCYCLQGNVIDRNAAQNGSGVSEDTAPTINSVDRHGVAYTADCRNLELNFEQSVTLQAKIRAGIPSTISTLSFTVL